MANTDYFMICSSPVNRTAIIRLHSLGDVVLAQPAATELSRNSEVFFLTSEEYEPVVLRMPGNISAVPVREGTGPLGLRKLLDGISPDSIVDLQNNLASRISTSGRKVTGRFSMNRSLRKRVMTHALDSMPMRADDFMKAAGLRRSAVLQLEKKSGIPSEGLRVGIVAGGRWLMKSVPSGVIAEISRILSDNHDAEIVLLGGRGDRELIRHICDSVVGCRIEAYTGETGIDGLIKTIEKLDILISPDSGPAHLAESLGIPVLVVFTSTSPSLGFWNAQRAGNYMVRDVSCRPCHRHGGNSCSTGTEECRKGILPYHLVLKAMELLKE